jgi:hypothetical protein
MKHSSLAERLIEHFAAEELMTSPAHGTSRLCAVPVAETPPRAPRRLSLTYRRIEIRDPGLRHFRVF